jgi:spermidine/putrescine transport system permease protein
VKLSLLTTIITFLVGLPTAWFIATRPPKSRALWLFLITIPFWTNLLIRTYAINEVIRPEGLINTLLIGIGLIDEPIKLIYTDIRDLHRHDLCLSAADGAAAVCRHRPVRHALARGGL